MNRDSFIVYRSFVEAIRKIKNQSQRLKVWDAMCDLALDGKDTELEGIPGAMFDLIKPQIVANNTRYQNGSKPKAKQKQNGSEAEARTKRNGSKTEANENVNENENENENDISLSYYTEV